MFDPMERGRQIREERHRSTGAADPSGSWVIRNSSANHPQEKKSSTTRLPANPQNPQGGNLADTAEPPQVETILAELVAAGRDLGTVEPVARWTMQNLSRAAAAELAVALDDAFQTANSVESAQRQCRRLLKNPQALEAAKAVWPDLPPPPLDAPAPKGPSGRPTANNVPGWLALVREHCPVMPEDESYLRRHMSNLSPGDALARAERYVSTWQQAAQAESRPTATDNAGRRAANQTIRRGTDPC